MSVRILWLLVILFMVFCVGIHDGMCQWRQDVEIAGERMDIGMSFDETNAHHFIGAFFFTSVLNFAQIAYDVPQEKYQLHTGLIMCSAIIAFEVGQANAGHYIDIADIGAGLAGVVASYIFTAWIRSL